MSNRTIDRTDRLSRPASRARTADRISGPPHSAHRRPFAADRHGGYDLTSLLLHWLVALGVLALIVASNSGAPDTYASLSLVLAPFLLIYALRRLLRGFPRSPDDPAWLTVLARLAMLVLLASIMTLATASLALPPLRGEPYAAFGLMLPAFAWSGDPELARTLSAMRGWADLALLGAVVIHLLLALTYPMRGHAAIALRMRHPVKRGH